MPRLRRDHEEDEQDEDRQQIAQATKQRLGFLIVLLLAIILVLIFRLGETWWFGWMIEYRTRIIGILLFAEILLGLWSPVIVEADTNPRRLDGPGNPPRGGSTW